MTTQTEEIVWKKYPDEMPKVKKGFYLVQLDLNTNPNDNWYECLLWKGGHFCWDWLGHNHVDEDIICWADVKGWRDDYDR